jgi:hypothetical protein
MPFKKVPAHRELAAIIKLLTAFANAGNSRRFA